MERHIQYDILARGSEAPLFSITNFAIKSTIQILINRQIDNEEFVFTDRWDIPKSDYADRLEEVESQLDNLNKYRGQVTSNRILRLVREAAGPDQDGLVFVRNLD